MTDPVVAAKFAEIGGSCTAVGCGLLNWLSANHDGVTAACGLGGLLIAAAGAAMSWHFQRKRDEREREDHAVRKFQRRSTDS